jgi:hypothetical protein
MSVEDCLDSRSRDGGMQAFPSIGGGTWLGHDPPDNDGHKRTSAACQSCGWPGRMPKDQQR